MFCWPILDGYYPIINLDEFDVTEIAKFAVTEYDKQTRAKLKFEKIIKAESKFVIGYTYHLIISANNGSVSNNYETFVYATIYDHKRGCGYGA